MEIIERKEAQSLSLSRYYTGNPCLRNHKSERYTKSGRCIQCLSDKTKDEYQKRKKNPERLRYMREYLKSYKHENKKASKDKYYKSNRDLILSKAKDYREKNKGFYNFLCQMRRKRIKLATPKAITESSLLEIRDIYMECAELNKDNKAAYHVDHIIPIKGDGVCGLHVPWNLQILTAEENLTKSNRVINA